MTDHVEHFIYGSAARLKKFRAALPEGVDVVPSFDGIMLSEALTDSHDLDAAIARIEALADQYGVDYDGHGQSLDGAEADDGQKGGDLLNESFAKRTGVKAGHGFALPLPDGRFGHGVFLGQDSAYLMFDISTLVTNAPASAEDLRASPMRYRQPILVWHTRFDALPLTPATPLATLPLTCRFRGKKGMWSPAQVKRLEKRFGIADTDHPKNWQALLVAMAAVGEHLPGVSTYSTWSISVGRTGKMKQTQMHDTQRYKKEKLAPMPWYPRPIDFIYTALCNGVDKIALWDFVRY